MATGVGLVGRLMMRVYLLNLQSIMSVFMSYQRIKGDGGYGRVASSSKLAESLLGQPSLTRLVGAGLRRYYTKARSGVSDLSLGALQSAVWHVGKDHLAPG